MSLWLKELIETTSLAGVLTVDSIGLMVGCIFFFFQAEDGIRDVAVTGVQTCALPICNPVLSVHHYWVTDAGDTIFVAPAQLTAFPVAPGLFAVVTYPVSITGGTDRKSVV